LEGKNPSKVQISRNYPNFTELNFFAALYPSNQSANSFRRFGRESNKEGGFTMIPLRLLKACCPQQVATGL